MFGGINRAEWMRDLTDHRAYTEVDRMQSDMRVIDSERFHDKKYLVHLDYRDAAAIMVQSELDEMYRKIEEDIRLAKVQTAKVPESGTQSPNHDLSKSAVMSAASNQQKSASVSKSHQERVKEEQPQQFSQHNQSKVSSQPKSVKPASLKSLPKEQKQEDNSPVMAAVKPLNLPMKEEAKLFESVKEEERGVLALTPAQLDKIKEADQLRQNDMNFRGISDIKELNDCKKVNGITMPKHLQYKPELDYLKKTFDIGGYGRRVVQVEDKEYLSKQLAMVKQLLNQGKLAQSIRKLEDLKQDGYKHSDLFYLLGECYRRVGKLEQANANLVEAMRFEQYTEYVWKSLGLIYLKSGHEQRGIQMLLKFSSLVNSGEEFQIIGDTLSHAGYFPEAVQQYTRALALNEHSAGNHLKRCICRCFAGEPSNLLTEDIKRAIEVTSCDKNSLYELLDILIQPYAAIEQAETVRKFIHRRIDDYF